MNLTLYPTSIPDLHYYIESGIPAAVLEDYYQVLFAHIIAVQEAAQKIGVPEEQYSQHDLSKFSKEEYGAYAMQFVGTGAPDAFASAWLHHIHHNPHHWQYWVYPDGYTPKGSKVEKGVVEMPRHFALEMIADWMGASWVYAKTEDMTGWLVQNMAKMILHSATAAYVREELTKLGYGEIVAAGWFKTEIDFMKK